MKEIIKKLFIALVYGLFVFVLITAYNIASAEKSVDSDIFSNSINQNCISSKSHKNNKCSREQAKPIINKTVFKNTQFQLQSDSISAIETVIFDNGDKLIIKNWGCEYYCLTFRFETKRFENNTNNTAFWYRKAVLLISEICKGIDAPIDIKNGNNALINHIDNYNKLQLGEEIEFGKTEIRNFVRLDKITKLTNKKFAIEITFSMGPL